MNAADVRPGDRVHRVIPEYPNGGKTFLIDRVFPMLDGRAVGARTVGDGFICLSHGTLTLVARCTGGFDSAGRFGHDGDTCPIHEDGEP